VVEDEKLLIGFPARDDNPAVHNTHVANKYNILNLQASFAMLRVENRNITLSRVSRMRRVMSWMGDGLFARFHMKTLQRMIAYEKGRDFATGQGGKTV
jgi:hypothetical protein